MAAIAPVTHKNSAWLNPTKEWLNESQLTRLQPYLLHLIRASQDPTLSSINLKLVTLDNEKIGFELYPDVENPFQLLENIVKIFKDKMRYSVAQMSSTTNLQLKALEFYILNNKICVENIRFVDCYGFDHVMTQLAQQYPHVMDKD